MKPIHTHTFECHGQQMISFDHGGGIDAGSHSYWSAILTIEAAEEFAGRLVKVIAEAKAKTNPVTDGSCEQSDTELAQERGYDGDV